MATSGRQAALLLTLLTLLTLRPCVQALNDLESLTDIDIAGDNQLGDGKRTSFRAQEQRAIFDLLTGILETLQTSARAQLQRERRKQLLEAALRDVTPRAGAKA